MWRKQIIYFRPDPFYCSRMVTFLDFWYSYSSLFAYVKRFSNSFGRPCPCLQIIQELGQIVPYRGSQSLSQLPRKSLKFLQGSYACFCHLVAVLNTGPPGFRLQNLASLFPPGRKTHSDSKVLLLSSVRFPVIVFQGDITIPGPKGLLAPANQDLDFKYVGEHETSPIPLVSLVIMSN